MRYHGRKVSSRVVTEVSGHPSNWRLAGPYFSFAVTYSACIGKETIDLQRQRGGDTVETGGVCPSRGIRT